MPEIRDNCKGKCVSYEEKYKACVDRVSEKGVGGCDGQYFEYLHCIDHHVGF